MHHPRRARTRLGLSSERDLHQLRLLLGSRSCVHVPTA